LQWSTNHHDWRFALKPSITGLAQLAGCRSARHSLRLDRLYLRKKSVALDVRTITLSFVVNLVGKTVVRRWMLPQRRVHR
jgi:lipopolysaccharide/colanic/teichoic acid biosynthesis glycosyltransferase